MIEFGSLVFLAVVAISTSNTANATPINAITGLPLNASKSFENRIVGGLEARLGQFPHQISMRYYSRHICGGSIITPTYVLTAAHCIDRKDPKHFVIIAGSVRLSDGGTAYDVSALKKHEHYRHRHLHNDIGLVSVKTPIKFSENVKPIAYAKDFIGGGKKAISSGWGRTKVSIPIIWHLMICKIA